MLHRTQPASRQAHTGPGHPPRWPPLKTPLCKGKNPAFRGLVTVSNRGFQCRFRAHAPRVSTEQKAPLAERERTGTHIAEKAAGYMSFHPG